MTEHVAPQEKPFEIPAAWVATLLPWRGKRTGRPVEPAHPEVVEARRQRIADHTEQLRTALAKPENEPFAAAGAAYLDGKADPCGAAVIATLMYDYEWSRGLSWLLQEIGCWIDEHGLAFAVAAAVERLGIAAMIDGHYDLAGKRIAERVVSTHVGDRLEGLKHELHYGGIAVVRSLLAAASDAEYAAAVAAVAAHRDTGAKRIAAMVLFPGEERWVLEGCTDYRKALRWAAIDKVLLHSISRPEHAAAANLRYVSGYRNDTESIAALLGGLGTEALPILLTSEEDSYNAGQRKDICRAIALIPDDAAIGHLLGRIECPQVFDAATDFAKRFPLRTLRVAARRVPGLTPERRRLATAIVNMVDSELHPYLDESERAFVEGLLAGDGRVPEAALDDLPPLLVSPPWTRKQPKAKPVIFDDLEGPADTRLVWAEGERERWRSRKRYADREHNSPYGYDTEVLAYAPDQVAAAFAERWEGDLSLYSQPDQVKRILARFDAAIADRLAAAIASQAALTEVLLPVLGTGAARVAAHRLSGKKTRNVAAAWFDRHGLATVPYLVPDALGADRKRRQYAEAALIHLASRHGGEAVTAVAESSGLEAAQAIAAMIDLDPLEPRGTIPKPGPWAVPATLPQVLLKDGERALPAEVIPNLITMLASGTPDQPYAGVEVVAGHCDRASLRRFSWALYEAWSSVGGPSKDGWALTQLMYFADDATVWRLAELIREWPGESQHQRAVAGLEVLGAIGTEEALRAIQTIADKVKFKGLKQEAGRQIERIAAGLGLDRERLADRLVPDFGLGETDALVFDYGPRQFTVSFDEQLKPVITDDTGKSRKSLPKPGANDDPVPAEEAYTRYTALKKELRTVAAQQVRRVEDAMVKCRDWSVDEFLRFFAEHPLTRHLARRLVWIAEIAGESIGFRIAEDGTFSDVEDDAVELAGAARIRVAHPIHFGLAVTKAWAELFADYEILQPFDQLNRPVMAFTEVELASGRLTRFENVAVEVGRILGMTNRGWERAAPEDGGMQPGIIRALPGGGFVTVTLDPGIYIADVYEYPVQTVERVRLRTDLRFDKLNVDEPVFEVPSRVDPLTASEILTALSGLTGAE